MATQGINSLTPVPKPATGTGAALPTIFNGVVETSSPTVSEDAFQTQPKPQTGLSFPSRRP